jgi:hypothetical protein
MKMKLSLLAIALLLALAIPAYSQPGTPILTAVDPVSGAIGDDFTAQGDNLDVSSVAALYLTDGKNDVQVLISEQTLTSIKFQLPPEAKPGRFALMVLTKGTKGNDARYIEEPVKITIEPAEKPIT